MRFNLKPLHAAILMACLNPFAAQAAVAPILGDTNLAASNVGSAVSLNVNPTNKSLLNFNLSALPSGIIGSDIAKATLVFYVKSVSTNGAVQAAPITSTWDESTVTSGTAPTQGAPEPPNTTVNRDNSYFALDVTNLVQDWVNSPATNFGLALGPVRTASLILDSKEAIQTSHPAYIEIVLQGSAGAQGPQGAAGTNGSQGPQGANGTDGSQGPQGANGTDGSQGPQGANGTDGSQGPQGASGTNGSQGSQGPQGATGSIGATGATGPNNLSGTTTTSFNALLKGTGTNVAAATAGTDYLLPNGSGANLTSLNASNLSTGTLPAARLPISGVAANTYTNATVIVDATGRVTSASNGSSGSGGYHWNTTVAENNTFGNGNFWLGSEQTGLSNSEKTSHRLLTSACSNVTMRLMFSQLPSTGSFVFQVRKGSQANPYSYSSVGTSCTLNTTTQTCSQTFTESFAALDSIAIALTGTANLNTTGGSALMAELTCN